MDNDNDTDIEMVSLTSESELEEDVVMDSDIDSELNTSDVELLLNGHAVNIQVHQKHSLLQKLERKLKSISLLTLWNRFTLHHKQQCIACCYCCLHKSESSLTQSKGPLCHRIISKIRMMFKLMIDRRVIVSIGLYGLVGFIAIITNEVIIDFYFYVNIIHNRYFLY